MSLSIDAMQSLMKHIDYNNLSNESMIDIINLLQDQLIKKTIRCSELKKSLDKANQSYIEEHNETEKMFERIKKNREESNKWFDERHEKMLDELSEKNQKIIDLESQIEHFKIDNDIYDGDPPAGEVPDIGQADDHSVTSDEELESMKMTNFTEFLQRCCIWSNVRITTKDQMNKKFYKIAPGSCDILYQAFKDWCVRNNIIKDRSKSKKNIPSKKEFFNLLVDNHRERYPDDWLQNGEQYPRSPNGSYKTPRVNLKLKSDFIEC